MTDISEMVNSMAKENLFSKMEVYSKQIGVMENFHFLVKDNIPFKMVKMEILVLMIKITIIIPLLPLL